MHIVLAIDGSEGARWAQEMVVALPLPGTREVTLITVLDLPHPRFASLTPMASRGYDEALAALRGEAYETAHAVLGKAREALEQHGACVAGRVHEGPVAAAIIEAVDVWRADLIVVGARGLGPVKEFLLGGVSQKVARYAPCSVLVVKRPVATIRRVLVALDGSIDAEMGVGFVAGLALPPDTLVHLSVVVELHGFVLPNTGSHPETRAATLRTIAESEVAAAERMLAEVRTVLGTKGWTVTSSVHIGDAADHLLREIHDVDPDLAILGAKGFTATKRFVLGSVAHKILKYAPCSVLLVRPWGALSHYRVLTWHAESRSRA